MCSPGCDGTSRSTRGCTGYVAVDNDPWTVVVLLLTIPGMRRDAGERGKLAAATAAAEMYGARSLSVSPYHCSWLPSPTLIAPPSTARVNPRIRRAVRGNKLAPGGTNVPQSS
jgi:hypothetical protein